MQVLAACRSYGLALQWAPARLRDDRDVVLAAVKQNGLALQYASERLRGDRVLVLYAARETIHALQLASETLRGDHDFCMRAIREHKRKLRYTDYVWSLARYKPAPRDLEDRSLETWELEGVGL